MNDRRSVIAKLGMAGIAASTPLVSPASAAPAVSGNRLNILDFGAIGDGIADDTAAFRKAFAVGQVTGDEPGRAVHVPAGRYRVDGTIYLRKGQALSGDGEASLIDSSRANGPTIVLGMDQNGHADPGGAPVGISRLRFLGGTGKSPVIHAACEGFSLSDLFLSAAGTAIEVTGADGIISNVIVDQALRGIALSSARNIVIQGLITYLANFAVTLEGATSDVIFSNAILAYSRYASVLFADGKNDIRSARFANCTFVSNESYATFLGHVHVRGRPLDGSFTGCTFRNWPGFAVRQQAGTGARLTFSDCIFDGSPSHGTYNGSPSASGILTGAGGQFRIVGCEFRNLTGPVVQIGPYLQQCIIDGGMIANCPAEHIATNAADSGTVKIRRVEGFGRRLSVAGGSAIILPYWGATTAWDVTASSGSRDGAITSFRCAVLARGANMSLEFIEHSRMGQSFALKVGFGKKPHASPQQMSNDRIGLLWIFSDQTDVEWDVSSAN